MGEESGKRFLPVVISSWEAYPIAMAMEKITPPRPSTIDLFTAMAHGFGLRLVETYIYKFQDGVFYSQLTFTDGERTLQIDGRTSDAVAIMMRSSGELYASKEVMEQAGVEIKEDKVKAPEPADDADELSEEQLTLEQLESELQQAIDTEDYNHAATLFELIKKKRED